MGPMETTCGEVSPVAGPRLRVAVITDFDLRQLAAAFQQTDVITSGNTGPMHLAGVLNRPLVALFSAHPAQKPREMAATRFAADLCCKLRCLRGKWRKSPLNTRTEHMSRIYSGRRCHCEFAMVTAEWSRGGISYFRQLPPHIQIQIDSRLVRCQLKLLVAYPRRERDRAERRFIAIDQVPISNPFHIRPRRIIQRKKLKTAPGPLEQAPA